MRVRLRDEGDTAGFVITDLRGENVGFIDCSAMDGWLDVRWIELAAEHRRRGLGAEAVRLLEAEAVRRWGVKRVRAHVPRDVGLALYFWLRLGYRPEVPAVGDGDTMAMVRELDSRGQGREPGMGLEQT
jgi:ribosomal protein S18 acetylase RimI-like enzyme